MKRQSAPNSIWWHENNIENMNNYVAGLKKSCDELQAKIDRTEAEIVTYMAQVARAKKENRTEFNAERFKALIMNLLVK